MLNNISLNISAGEVWTLLGRNGCGKSTLIKSILGFIKPFNGTINIHGVDQRKYSIRELAKNIAYVSQDYYLNCDYTVMEYVMLGRAPYIAPYSSPGYNDRLIVMKCINELNLQTMKDVPINRLSGGERQIAVIARALAQETDIVILDEPTSALDLSNQILLLKTIKKVSQSGKTVIYSSHNPNHAIALNSKICFLLNGCVYKTGYSKDLISNDTINDVYGDGISVTYQNNIPYCKFDLSL